MRCAWWFTTVHGMGTHVETVWKDRHEKAHLRGTPRADEPLPPAKLPDTIVGVRQNGLGVRRRHWNGLGGGAGVSPRRMKPHRQLPLLSVHAGEKGHKTATKPGAETTCLLPTYLPT